MAEYEIAWQIFGTRTITAESEEEAFERVGHWLDDTHDMDSSVVDGWDYRVMGVE